MMPKEICNNKTNPSVDASGAAFVNQRQAIRMIIMAVSKSAVILCE